jgi:hypothetical protein
MERLRSTINELMMSVLEPDEGISETKEIIVFMSSLRCPNIDLVDLPGLVASNLRSTYKQDLSEGIYLKRG